MHDHGHDHDHHGHSHGGDGPSWYQRLLRVVGLAFLIVFIICIVGFLTGRLK